MINRSIVRRLLVGAATGLALTVAGVALPEFAGGPTAAMAQSADDMAAALDAYGHWVRHARYGEVWVPEGVPSDWQPYEYGHWVFTDDWGWYWISDENEDDWGWVVYHYGRWAFDRTIGWFWVPGDEWAPAWVDWRYGGDNVGWAPLPPDDLVDAYDERPDYWVYVPLRYIGEPRLRSHFLPRDRRMIMLRETRLINRPVRVEGRRLWVNPGLSPGFIAGRTHVALHAYQVRPRVFGATTSVQGAVTVRQQDLRIKGAVRRAAPITVQRSTTPIQAATTTAAPKALGKGERGQLGSHPPRAAQGGVTTQPQTPSSQPPAGVAPRTGPAPLTTTPTAPRTGPAPLTTTPTAPRTGPAPVTTTPTTPRTGPAPGTRPTTPPSPTPGAAPSGQPPQAKPVRPVVPQTPPPVQSAPRQPTGAQPAPPPHRVAPAPPPPPAVRAPAPPPPPAARAPAPPPPPAARAPAPPPSKQVAPAKPGDKKPDEPK
jgi:hypothetical protein